jgi:D-alanine-D-alanine ligase
MRIGIAFDLKADFAPSKSAPGGAPVQAPDAAPGEQPDDRPDDLLEEYDSPTTVEAIARVLASRGHEPLLLGGGRRFVERALESRPELVFNIAEGRGSRSREAHVPAVCEMLGIPCTHSDPLTMAVSLDKGMAKRVVASAGVPTPRFAVVDDARQLADIELAYPLFAKPLFEGSSMGVRRRSRVESPRELAARVELLLGDYGEPVLVEEFCAGNEYTVAILGTGANAHAVSAMEVVPLVTPIADFVYSLEVKRNPNWREEIRYDAPPRRPPGDVAAIEKVALDAYRALGCRDVGRVDVRCDGANAPKFIEVNPLPGLAPGWSDLALLWERIGRSYDDLILSILDQACARLRL